MSKAMSWEIHKLWNESFNALPVRKSEPRDYIWASELGSSLPDLYLKMKGEPFTNPPNVRALRKFQAGHVWESTIHLILMRLGLIQSTQDRVYSQLDGCVKVSGKVDFLSNEYVDFAAAEQAIEQFSFNEFFMIASRTIMEHFKTHLTSVKLQKYVIECKSTSSIMFDRNEAANAPQSHHALQTYHYALNLWIPGKILYVSKDDCRLQEYSIAPDSMVLGAQYTSFIEQITEHYRSGIMPAKEQPIVFDYDSFRFSKSFRLEYSPYLTLHTGIPDQLTFYNMYAAKATALNRVYKRFVNGDTITKKNIEVVEQSDFSKDWDRLVQLGKLAGVAMEEEEEVMA